MSVPTVCAKTLREILSIDLLLADRIPGFNNCGSSQRDPVRQFAITFLEKKAWSQHVDDVSSDADSRALDLFLEMNERCAAFSFRDPSPVFETILGEIKSFLYHALHKNSMISSASGSGLIVCRNIPSPVLDVTAGHANLDVGPGAAVGSNGYSFFHKFGLSSQTFSNTYMRDQYLKWCQDNPRHPIARSQNQAFSIFGDPGIDTSSRLCFVPKRNEISRTITVCPSGDVLYQKGYQSILESRLKSLGPWSIDLEDQQAKNRFLAKIGSMMARDGSKDPLCTIDLKSASDTISIGLAKAILPRSIVDAINLCRPPCVQLPDGEVIPLDIFVSMGNAVCFPLQTLIFLSVVASVYKLMGIPSQVYNYTDDRPNVEEISRGLLPNFAVNGDDIIVRKSSFNAVCQTLHTLGFIINHDKSYSEGSFRESCGADLFEGSHVRPVFIKQVRTIQDIYTIFNRLQRWGARHNVYLRNTLRYLYYGVPKPERLKVPMYENYDAGFHMCSRNVRCRKRYYAYTAVPISIPLGLRENPFFDETTILCAVRGMLRDNRLALRTGDQAIVTYKRVRRESFNWDYPGDPPPQYEDVSHVALERQQCGLD